MITLTPTVKPDKIKVGDLISITGYKHHKDRVTGIERFNDGYIISTTTNKLTTSETSRFIRY